MSDTMAKIVQIVPHGSSYDVLDADGGIWRLGPVNSDPPVFAAVPIRIIFPEPKRLPPPAE